MRVHHQVPRLHREPGAAQIELTFHDERAAQPEMLVGQPQLVTRSAPRAVPVLGERGQVLVVGHQRPQSARLQRHPFAQALGQRNTPPTQGHGPLYVPVGAAYQPGDRNADPHDPAPRLAQPPGEYVHDHAEDGVHVGSLLGRQWNDDEIAHGAAQADVGHQKRVGLQLQGKGNRPVRSYPDDVRRAAHAGPPPRRRLVHLDEAEIFQLGQQRAHRAARQGKARRQLRPAAHPLRVDERQQLP